MSLAAPLASASGAPGPAVQPTIAMNRISGADRYATAVALAKSEYPTKASTVFIATGANYPDALAASPVASKVGGPLLLTDPDSLPASVVAELSSLAPTTVVVIGGAVAVSPAVTAQIAAAVPSATIKPLSGSDRFTTALDVVEFGFTSAPAVYVATADNYPDALSAAGAAGDKGDPVVLVDGTSGRLSAGVSDLLTKLGTAKVTIVGGPAAVSSGIESTLDADLGSSNVTRLAGVDRYATSSLVDTATFPTASSAYIATGTNYPDALAGSAFAAHHKLPLFLVPSTCVPVGTLSAFTKLGVGSATLIGGESAVSDSVTTLATCSTIPSQPAVAPTSVLGIAPVDSSGNHANTMFEKVDCVSAASCVAVGFWGGRGLIAADSNGAWRRVDAPLPPDAASSPSVGFNGLSCASATSCAAVGEYTNKAGQTGGLIETLNGQQWTASEIPLPSGSASGSSIELDGVSCGRVGQCVASGGYDAHDSQGNWAGYGFVLTLSGKSWVETDEPAYYPTSSFPLTSVSCTSAEWCLAVGSDDSGGTGIAFTFSGSWTVDLFDSGFVDHVESVTCAQEGECTAIGNGHTTQTERMERLSNGAWTGTNLTVPSGTGDATGSQRISCAGQFCASIGAYSLTTRHYLLTTWGNGMSSVVEPPVPANAIEPAFLDAVACTSPSYCVAVGSYSTFGSGWLSGIHVGVGLVETFANGVWTPTETPSPGGETAVDEYELTGVSCVADSVCEAAGWNDFIDPDIRYTGNAALGLSIRP